LFIDKVLGFENTTTLANRTQFRIECGTEKLSLGNVSRKRNEAPIS
jgi:hypothetical protein